MAPPEILAGPHGAAVAGWEQLTIKLSAGAAGLRHVLVVLDGAGRPISASDTVLYKRDLEILLESVGGRLEEDGTFCDTRWKSAGIEAEGSEPRFESTPSEPSAADVAAIKALVTEMIRRGGPPA